MKNFKLPPELFTLSKEQEELSVSIYGKVIKCLVAPYHAQPPIDMIIYYSDGVELIQLKDVIVSQEQADRQSTMIENYQEELDPDDSILYSE